MVRLVLHLKILIMVSSDQCAVDTLYLDIYDFDCNGRRISSYSKNFTLLIFTEIPIQLPHRLQLKTIL